MPGRGAEDTVMCSFRLSSFKERFYTTSTSIGIGDLD
jgi:hypothetical protein